MRALAVGGFEPFSTVDYPGKLAAVVFVRGCPWRCGYCHNTHLQTRDAGEPSRWHEIEAFLARRRGLLDAIVFSGGEPTVDAALPSAITTCKALGYKVGLHTAGSYPERLRAVLPWLDWVGFDVKHCFDRYADVTQVAGSGNVALKSAELLLQSGVAHEFRHTYHSALIGEAALERVGRQLYAIGVRHVALQEFRAAGCASALLRETHTGITPASARALAQRFPRFELRRA